MTHRTLVFRLILTGIVLIVFLIASYFNFPAKKPGEAAFIAQNGTLIGILFATWIAFCFQQRAKFIDDVRKWWNEIVLAKSALLSYLDKGEDNRKDFYDAFYKLSTAMDTLRLVYKNVDQSAGNAKGYYPFEQVRDLIDMAKALAPEHEPTPEFKTSCKVAIEKIFQSLRHSIQEEAKAIVPDNAFTFNSAKRREYIEEIKIDLGIDIESIRKANKARAISSSSSANTRRP